MKAVVFYKQRNFRTAFTFIEAIVTTAILCIIAIGSLNFQYFTARDSKISRAQITATRTAQLLLEDWMSTGGSEDYNPVDLDLGFQPIEASPPDLDEYGSLGTRLRDTVFTITVDEFPMLVVLVSSDIACDEIAEITLRQLSVIVSFGLVLDEDTVQSSDYIKPVVLTTYVRVDAGGG